MGAQHVMELPDARPPAYLRQSLERVVEGKEPQLVGRVHQRRDLTKRPRWCQVEQCEQWIHDRDAVSVEDRRHLTAAVDPDPWVLRVPIHRNRYMGTTDIRVDDASQRGGTVVRQSGPSTTCEHRCH